MALFYPKNKKNYEEIRFKKYSREYYKRVKDLDEVNKIIKEFTGLAARLFDKRNPILYFDLIEKGEE